MAISLKKVDGSEYLIETLTYSNETKSFIANEASGEVVEFNYPLDRDVTYNIPKEQFKCHIFQRDNLAANDIFEIKFKKQRLGWFFPIQALLTDQHDFAENEHFLPYAEAAYQRLVMNLDDLPYKKIDYQSKISLDQLYGENTFILVLYTYYLDQYKKEFAEFDLTNFLLFFYGHGYTLLVSANFEQLYKLSITPKFSNFPEHIVQIKPLSSDLIADKTYINSLFQGLLKLESHPLVKFHLLYSLVELFIGKIFEFEFAANIHLFQNPTDFYDAKEKLNKLTNEKSRLNKLFESQCPGITQPLLQDLKDLCNNFLDVIDTSKKHNRSASEGIYKVRSAIFHNLRNMPSNYADYLIQIIEKLEEIILEIILKLKLK